MTPIIIPIDGPKKELRAFMRQNKMALIAQKRALPKECDGFGIPYPLENKKNGYPYRLKVGNAIVEINTIPANTTELEVTVIINTTNFIDSCLDCHMPGLWDKSLSENKMRMFLQEHQMTFDHIIADGKDLQAYVQTFAWNALGFKYPGSTQALVFKAIVKKARNAFMFDQYAQGYVKNHSVFMQYVKMVLCINEPDSTDDGAEYEAWQKYYPFVANKEVADEFGVFWAINEAKEIEGSAVPRGANIVTPTLSVQPKQEPGKPTPKKEEQGKTTPNIYKLKLGVPDKGFVLGKRLTTK